MSDAVRKTLGVYIGPMVQERALAALAAHGATVGGEFIVYLHDPAGRLVWLKHAALEVHVSAGSKVGGDAAEEPKDADGRELVFVFARPLEQTAGNPRIMVDAPLVLMFSEVEDLKRLCSAEQYSGGVRLHMGFGPYRGHALTLVFSQSLLRVMESGDVVPGPVQIEFENLDV